MFDHKPKKEFPDTMNIFSAAKTRTASRSRTFFTFLSSLQEKEICK